MFHVYWSESELSFVVGQSAYADRPTLSVATFEERESALLTRAELNTFNWESGQLSALLMRTARQRETERAFHARRYSA